MSSTPYDWAKNIPCRNIQIHGFCKFEHKGCSYNHDLASKESSIEAPPSASTSESMSDNHKSKGLNGPKLNTSITSSNNTFAEQNSISSPVTSAQHFKPTLLKQSSSFSNEIGPNGVSSSARKFNVASPAFTPISANKFSAMSPSLDTIPTFTPSNIPVPNYDQTHPQQEDPSAVASTLTSPTNDLNVSSGKPHTSNESPLNDMNSLKSSISTATSFNPVTAPIFTPDSNLPSNPTTDAHFHSQPLGEQLFYQNTNPYPVNFLLYAPPPPPHIELNKRSNERTVNDLFIDNKLREYLQMKNEESLKSISHTELDLPRNVGVYHSLYPIDKNFDYSTKSFGYTSIVYKCMSNTDGRLYAMRRLQNVPISSASVLNSVKKWKKLNCSNVVKIHEVFTSRAFNDNSLVLIYDYYPMSLNLMENHFMSLPGKNPELITEDCLWNYTIQLLNAITEASKLSLTIGELNPSKIIITNKGRIRLSAVAIKDIIKDVKNSLNNTGAVAKKEEPPESSDLLELGKLIFFLAKSTTLIQEPSDDPAKIVAQLKYSSAFKDALLYLLSGSPTIEEFQRLVAPMILKLADGLQNSCDAMESTLMGELENARLVRLFAKLDFISERPEMVKDGSWSETGERYPIKLFKDYVFHQIDDNGNPVVDLTHVINCLNKLDAGVDENLLLVSPDEMTCLIMSYKELKELINKTFLTLLGKE